MFKFNTKLIPCVLGKHKRKYWSKEKCENNNVIEGVFTPWECEICREKSQVFKIPPAPRMKVPKTCLTK